MSYELSYKHEPDYLYVQATGIRTVQNIVDMSKDFLAKCGKHRYSKALVDMSGMTGIFSTTEIYKMGTGDLLELWRTTGRLKISIIDLEANREQFEFMENVTFNLGINLRIFTDVDKAEAWLDVSKSHDGE